MRLSVTAAFFLFALTVAGQRPAKQPWEWTLEERLAMRLDPAGIAKRRQHDARELTVEEPGEHRNSIDGNLNPELFLPHELFRSLMSGFARDDARRRHQREGFRRGIIAAGFDEEEFWSTLRSATETYVDNWVYPPPGTKPPEIPGVRWPMCREAFLALNRAREAFGKERFDRFLYEVVAPGTQYASATNAPDPSAELRFVAGGCQ